MDAITFDQLPKAVSQLAAKLDRIEQLLQKQSLPKQDEPEELLSIDNACALLNLAKPTVYGLVSQGKLPYMKQGKKLYFLKKELMDWLKLGHKSVKEELAAVVDRTLVSTQRKRG